jgi:regulatory protein
MPPVTAYEKAVQLLASRPHFRRQLAAKLAQRGYPPEEIEAALDRLTAEGYLDDRQAAASFVETQKGWGRVRVRAELARRGADPEAVDEAVAALPEDDLPEAREAAAAWDRKGGKDARSLARHLERKGFSRRAIVAVLKDLPDAPELDETT